MNGKRRKWGLTRWLWAALVIQEHSFRWLLSNYVEIWTNSETILSMVIENAVSQIHHCNTWLDLSATFQSIAATIHLLFISESKKPLLARKFLSGMALNVIYLPSFIEIAKLFCSSAIWLNKKLTCSILFRKVEFVESGTELKRTERGRPNKKSATKHRWTGSI